jgi:hypothetical protein
MTNPVTDTNGTRRWYNDKEELHNENGPAVQYFNGLQSWWENGIPLHHDTKGPITKKDDKDYSKYAKAIKETILEDIEEDEDE